MKIALLIHDINNLGGIITYVERLAKGLQEAGHICDILKLCYQEKVSDSRTRAEGYRQGATDLVVHPIFGWSFPLKNRIPYKGAAIEKALERISSYDLAIWETPAPSMPVNKMERENLEWMKLFHNSAKQIITIHDGNLLGLYPHLLHAVSGVPNITVTAPHPRGYNSAKHLGLDQTLVMIPQDVSNRNSSFFNKQKGFMACQIFKAWKHVDETVRAIAYMKSIDQSPCKWRAIGGIGLHYYYMTSPDKCKYFWEQDSQWPWQRIWDVALTNGMIYCGALGFEERDKLLDNSLLFLDPSWVNDGLGNHLNGAVAEGIRLGCVPVGKPLTFRLSENDTEAIYQPGRNYLEIPQNATDKEYAECLEEFSNISMSRWQEITERNYENFDTWFDYRVVSQQLVNQATKGVNNSGAMKWQRGSGTPSEQLIKSSWKMLATFDKEGV